MSFKKRLFLICGVLAVPSLELQADDVSVALRRPVTASSQQEKFPASDVTDGVISRKSTWMSAESARLPHILDINLERYYDINRIAIYTDIPENELTKPEKGKAPGFWSMKNFKIQYWDDANWTNLPDTGRTENRSGKLEFVFKPTLQTFQIRLVSTDGEPVRINEFEVYGKEKANMPVPVIINKVQKTVQEPSKTEMQITITREVIGKSMKYVAYNQGCYFPGSNIPGRFEYSNVSNLRVQISLNDYVPQSAVLNDERAPTLDDFEVYETELRNSSERNRSIRWEPVLENCRKKQFSTNSMVFEYALKELKRLNVEPVLQINSTDFDGTWNNKWKQWQRFYALAFYAAKAGDVTMYAMRNEPNHRHAGPMEITQYVDAMKIVSDTVYCAVQDVNKLHGKCLKSRSISPVTAGSNANWWAEVVKNLHIDYRGLPSDRDLLGIFSTYSYNLPAAGYASKVSDIRKTIMENHPMKQSLPTAYTETGRWMNAYLIDKEETMDPPSSFTEWAGEYANNTLNQGYGMWAFKFANTTSGTYPRGIKSGHHFIWRGKRIVEDAYNNMALGKKTSDLTSSHGVIVKAITDEDKTDVSVWVFSGMGEEKCLEINLGESYSLGGAVVYTGSSYGIYTSPDRVKNFNLQYWDGIAWVDIKETMEKNTRYAQSFFLFDTPVMISKVRFVSTDKGSIKVREIKLFGSESVKDIPSSYDISGTQRTGEVVRLFAKGFKNERPLLSTVKFAADNDMDAITCSNPEEMRYYIWLAQRKHFSNNLTLNMKSLDLSTGIRVIVGEVGANAYSEVIWSEEVSENGQLSFEPPGQSMMLLTTSVCMNTQNTLVAVDDAIVKTGRSDKENFGKVKMMNVEVNASRVNGSQVSYVKFDLSGVDRRKINAAIFQIYGNSIAGRPYRFHVYALDNNNWDENTLSWRNAPNLEGKQVRITDVGGTAHVAGEIAVDKTAAYHQLDVTELLRNCRE